MPLPRHPYLDPDRVEHDLGGAARRDPFGHRLHLVFGVLWCFFVSWPTSAVEIAGIPLIVFFLLRTPNIWRTWGSFAVQPLSIAIACWAAWQAVTLAWSPAPRRGLEELAANRWVWAMWMLWPIMAHRTVLIGALAAGFLCGNLSQLLHAAGQHWAIPALVWPRLPDRNSGWWDPVVGGSLLVGALGLHLPAAIMGRGTLRWLATAGCLIELVAIGATGTRGAWLAAAGLIAITLIIALARIRPARRAIATTAAVAVLAAVSIGVVWIVAGDSIARRAEAAAAEVRRAINEGDYNSDTGARLFMARAALDAWRRNPIGGVGAGGFREALARAAQDAGMDPASVRLHSHAHNAALHIAATTGAIGLLLAGAVVALALRGAFSELGPGGLGTYAAGPAFALLGLLLVSLFDPVHLNAQTAAMLATLLAMSLVSRPQSAAIAFGPSLPATRSM